MSTDPTYLRAIHDSLLSGMLHKDNASALPMGLVGMYEEALPLASHANEREKFLAFFAVWALLKKEASSGFVLPLLNGWTENQVLDYIGRYSKWFNSPESGKYVLYHERFRAFLLQKFPQNRFAGINEAIIYQCQLALDSKSGDEWELYALEYLSTHLLISAMESKDVAKLKTLAYDNAHWNRQVAMSKGFEWSKRMLNDMMLWASKYDEDEVIECLLSKVDLHQQEQNDAPRIVELVAQNDIETALQRIESFGGNDQEGLQRKFILYMLCLMELTLLDSKDKPFRKEEIEKLLKHLDDILPVDHSVLNWNDFFPSYLLFLMACEWESCGLEVSCIFKRTKDLVWKEAWQLDKVEFNDLFKKVGLPIGGFYDSPPGWDYFQEDLNLIEIKSELKVGDFAKAIDRLTAIENGDERTFALCLIAEALIDFGQIERALEILKYLDFWTDTSLFYRNFCRKRCADALANLDQFNLALKVLRAINYSWDFQFAIRDYIEILAKKNQFHYLADRILGGLEVDKNEIKVHGDIWGANSTDVPSLCYPFGTRLVGRLSNPNMVVDSDLDLIKKIRVYLDFADYFRANDNLNFEIHCIRYAIELQKDLKQKDNREWLIQEIAEMLFKLNYLDLFFEQIWVQMESEIKVWTIHQGVKLLLEIANLDLAAALVKKAIPYFTQIEGDGERDYCIEKLIPCLTRVGLVEELIQCVEALSDESEKENIFAKGCALLAEHKFIEQAEKVFSLIQSDAYLKVLQLNLSFYRGDFLTALEYFELIEEESEVLEFWLGLYSGFSMKGDKLQAEKALKNAIDFIQTLSNIPEKDDALEALVSSLLKHGENEEALNYIEWISEGKRRATVLQSIVLSLVKDKKWELAKNTSTEIPFGNIKQETWEKMGRQQILLLGWREAVLEASNLQQTEARGNYLKGLMEPAKVLKSNITKESLLACRMFIEKDIQSLENVMYQFSLNSIFLQKAHPNLIVRLNNTFNILWANDFYDFLLNESNY
jgi:hypothetical protein